MGFFGKLIQTTIDIAVLPVEIVKDVATLGGVTTDQKKSYTEQRVEKAAEHARDVYDELGDL